MHRTSFPTFHKVWDELVLKEITLDSDTLMAPLQEFYCNNTQAPPPSAQTRPPDNGDQGQGQECSHGRGSGGRGSDSNAPSQGNQGQDNQASLAPTS
jgi:hypothetical protein